MSKYPVVVDAEETPYEVLEDGIRHYELENVTLESGAKVDRDHTDYSGNGFVGGMFNGSAKIMLNVNAPESKAYKMTLRYANGHGDDVEDKIAAITVNGQFVKGIELPKTGSWDSWSTVEFELELAEGTSTIAIVNSSSLTGVAGDGNFDYLDIEMPTPEQPEDPEEPETPQEPSQPSTPVNPSGQQPTGNAASSNRTPSSSGEQYTVPVAAIPETAVPTTAAKAPSILPADASVPVKEDKKVEEAIEDNTEENTEEVVEEKTEEIQAETNVPETIVENDDVPSSVSEKKASPVVPIAAGVVVVGAGAAGFTFIRRRRL